MTVHVFGSINLDRIYRVPHLARPGETLASRTLTTVLGGKGANQSLALARAGAEVAHLGRLGRDDGAWLNPLEEGGVSITGVELVDDVSGHAIIQVDDAGENSIVLHGGANRGFDRAALDRLFASMQAGDWLLMQNECDGLTDAFAIVAERDVRLAFNPAPMDEAVRSLPLDALDLLVVNQTEAAMLLGLDINASVDTLKEQLSKSLRGVTRVLTLGAQGACLLPADSDTMIEQAAPAVQVVDTTGAGDTFVGYLLAALVAGLSPVAALERAVTAGALAVTRAGATPSIPDAAAVDAVMLG